MNNYFEKYKYISSMTNDEKIRFQNLDNFYDEIPFENSSKTSELSSQKNLEWEAQKI